MQKSKQLNCLALKFVLFVTCKHQSDILDDHVTYLVKEIIVMLPGREGVLEMLEGHPISPMLLLIPPVA